MQRRFFMGSIIGAIVVVSGIAVAQTPMGTAAEAKALLEKAVAAVKADKAKAIAAFNSPTGGFKDRDLYVFCANAGDGTINAGPPSVMGRKVQELTDKKGKAFGMEMLKVSAEGKFGEVSYMFPRPGADTTPVEKISYVTKVADQMCGVGYYK